jgi:hypothetical protein
MASYGMPILVVLTLCYFGWTVNPGQRAFSLASAIKFVSENPLAAKPFVEILFSEFKWGLSPALVSVYITYHVDRQIDPLLPDIVSLGTYRQLLQRIIMFVVFARIVAWLSLQPTLSIKPSSPSTWPIDKLRAVIMAQPSPLD